MGNYTREEVIQKLKKIGLRAVYFSNTQTLSHFEALPHVVIGIKSRGYLDFLGVTVTKRQKRDRL